MHATICLLWLQTDFTLPCELGNVRDWTPPSWLHRTSGNLHDWLLIRPLPASEMLRMNGSFVEPDIEDFAPPPAQDSGRLPLVGRAWRQR